MPKDVLTLRLPNGLELSMFARASNKMPFVRTNEPHESEDELWERFIHAIDTTDFKALSTFYKSARRMPSPKVSAPRDSGNFTRAAAPLPLNQAQVVK
jgi:hypothetical protein